MHRTLIAMFTAGALLCALTPARADSGVARTLHFSTAMVPTLGDQAERDGDMIVTIAPDGSISGTYRGTAPKSDSLYGKTVPVTGTLSGTRVHLEIGQNGELHVDGSLDQNGIVATGSVGNQQLYDFVGAPASG
jgi:hypothetical protein